MTLQFSLLRKDVQYPRKMHCRSNNILLLLGYKGKRLDHVRGKNSYPMMVSYALTMAETVECQKPFIYHKTVTSNAMNCCNG